ncbi:hypothetical protein QO004_000454 [Rhizobium mesoamericanum]|uniref:hypothetical protein n=1 Tax=Rhizobium mesoamericanum TaxID=1079800 RepID=UPI00278792D2|nr:hypothetical protein [Rhizobium mesoamericanum]MDQ0558679.1 hypothetical protein [Rhizobium mesoamericanum]
MPRNNSGVYSKPAGTTAVAGNLIDPVPWNSLTTDLGNEITNSLPRDGSAPMTAPLQASAGTALLPSLTFNTAATTGFYLKSASEIGIVSGAAEVATIGGYGLKLGAFASKSAAYTPVLADNNAIHRFTATTTVTFTAAATLGLNWRYTVIADNANVLLDPNGSETINGATTLLLYKGQSADIVCDGTGFYAVVTKESSPDYLKGLITVRTSGTRITVGTGEIRANGYFVQNLANIAKDINATWVAGNNAGGMETGRPAVVVNQTYFLHALTKLSDGSFDWLYSDLLTPSNIPTGYVWVGRFWSVYTLTGPAIATYTQVGNVCYVSGLAWFTTGGNVVGGNATLPATIPCPSGISVRVAVYIDGLANGSSSFGVDIGDGYSPVTVRQHVTAGIGGTTSSQQNSGAGSAYSNTARQLYVGVSFSGTGSVTVSINGWDDFTLNRVY